MNLTPDFYMEDETPNLSKAGLDKMRKGLSSSAFEKQYMSRWALGPEKEPLPTLRELGIPYESIADGAARQPLLLPELLEALHKTELRYQRNQGKPSNSAHPKLATGHEIKVFIEDSKGLTHEVTWEFNLLQELLVFKSWPT
jgi:hypothetical protein